MLHRSFKSAKCKTSLKLVVSRIKLLKNKSAAHIVKLKREVAQLLESGQERTARIQVEHVVREEKTMAAYDLLEVYCELIVARISMIESQKNCPIDLKEAVTSVIFASQRCADLPELQDIRKHLQSKYGKEFSTAAVELRPNCGVSRLMIEKLSVAAPDAHTKTKILSAIALEHNIVWNPETSGENSEKPSEDRLNGPNTFLRASQNHEQPPVQAPTTDTPKHDAYLHEKPSSPAISQNFGSSAAPSTSQSQQGASNVRVEKVEHRYTYSGDQTTYAAGNQNWNMEFTDATSAAHAAAEAAERASIAARAAAELSSGGRFLRQQQSESPRSTMNDMRNASIDKHGVPTISNANVTNVDAKKLQHGGESRMETDKIPKKSSRKTHEQPDAGAALQNEEKGKISGKSKMPQDPVFENEGMETNSKLDSSPGSDHFSTDSKRNSRDNYRTQGTNTNELGIHNGVNEQLFQHVISRGSSRSDSLKSEASLNEDVEHENMFAAEIGFDRGRSNYKSTEAENVNFFADEVSYKGSNSGTSQSHPTPFNDVRDDLEHDEFHVHITETAVFDNSDSDDDADQKIDFTGGFKDDDPKLFRSPDQRSPIYESSRKSSLFASDASYDEIVSKPFFANNDNSSMKLFSDQPDIVGSSYLHDSLPVAFDKSDTEDESDEYNRVIPSTQESLSRHTDFSARASNCECVTTSTKFDEDQSQHHISRHSDVSDKESKPTREAPNRMRDEKSITLQSLDTENKLNLELPIGGLRNKGKTNPYVKSLSVAPSLTSDETSVNDTTSSPTGFRSRRTDKKSPRFKASDYYEDSSNSEGENPQISTKPSQKMPSQNTSSVTSHTKSSFNSRPIYSDSDNEERTTVVQVPLPKLYTGSSSLDSPVSSRTTYQDNDHLQNKEGATVPDSRPKPRLSTGLSRRTKTSTPDGHRKPSRETPLSVVETGQEEQSEVPKLTRPVPRKSALELKRHPIKPSSSNEKSDSSINASPKPSAGTGSSSNPKAEQAAVRQDSIKKASHVHPKLPDFDTLAAHFSSLRRDNK